MIIITRLFLMCFREHRIYILLIYYHFVMLITSYNFSMQLHTFEFESVTCACFIGGTQRRALISSARRFVMLY